MKLLNFFKNIITIKFSNTEKNDCISNVITVENNISEEIVKINNIVEQQDDGNLLRKNIRKYFQLDKKILNILEFHFPNQIKELFDLFCEINKIENILFDIISQKYDELIHDNMQNFHTITSKKQGLAKLEWKLQDNVDIRFDLLLNLNEMKIYLQLINEQKLHEDKRRRGLNINFKEDIWEIECKYREAKFTPINKKIYTKIKEKFKRNAPNNLNKKQNTFYNNHKYNFGNIQILTRKKELLNEPDKNIYENSELKVDELLDELERKGYKKIPKIFNPKNNKNEIRLKCTKVFQGSQEYDHIIIGENGIFNIENKYFSGEISMDEYGNWARYQLGNKKNEDNPKNQVEKHRKVLCGILDNKYDIIDVICISHQKGTIKKCDYTPINVVKSELLLKFISNYKSNVKLDEFQIIEITTLIEKHRVIAKKSLFYNK